MMKLMKKALALAALAACGTASAGLLTFDDLAPTIYAGGDLVSQTDVSATVLGDPAGFAGALANGADPFSCSVTACPGGNASNYFAGLNDGGLNLSAGGRFVSLKSLDFSFVGPMPITGLANFGQLVVEGLGLDGNTVVESREFGAADANGEFSFASWDLSAGFASTWFSGVNVYACLYTANGDCVNPAGNQAQFAVDNLAYAVPEPSSIALVGLSLAGLAALRRRRSSI